MRPRAAHRQVGPGLALVVRNEPGLTLVSEKTGEERVYRIVAKDAAPKRKGKSGHKAA
jgi:hypothetical protein